VIPAAITAAGCSSPRGSSSSTGTTAQAGTTVAGGWQTTDDGGGVNQWNSTTAAKALTMANLPPDLQVLFYGQTGAGGQFASGTSAKIVSDPNTGGGSGTRTTSPWRRPAPPPHAHAAAALPGGLEKGQLDGTAGRHPHRQRAPDARLGQRRHGGLHPRPRGQRDGRRHAQLPVRLVDSPSLTNAAHWENLEGLAGILPGQTRPVRWPGTIAAVLAGATSPNVVIDVLVDRC
jgi:hypothetical protein